MLAWEIIDEAWIPGGTEKLRLKRRGAEFSITLGPVELMNSRRGGSEEALAELASRRLAGVARPRVLIGGLGMGFTLRAAQRTLPRDATIVVAELVPAVVAWARGPLGDVFGDCLVDPRVSILEGDVAAVMSRGPAFDAILLDVDNGPAGQVRAENDGLYDERGLLAARAVLRPGGILAIWSIAPDAAFTGRLKRCGFAVEEHAPRAHGGRGARHTLWIAAAGRVPREPFRPSRVSLRPDG